MDNIEQKANEIMDKFRTYVVMWTGGTEVGNENLKQCALICVDKMLEVLGKLRKPEYTTFIEWGQLKTQEEADTMDGYEYKFIRESKRKN